jgi:cofilin
MSSGVSVSALSKTAYEEVKKDKKHRYIFYHIKDNTVIEVESYGSRDETYTQFLEKLGHFKSECRYCLFDFPASIPVEGVQEKSSMSVDRLVLMLWCPGDANVKQKMLYSSSYDALKKALVGVYKYVQANDYDDASISSVQDKLNIK